MNKLSISLIVFLIFFRSSVSFAQDKIIKMNGEEIDSVIAESKGNSIFYKKYNSKDNKTKRISSENVFLIVHPNGKEEVVYARDTIEYTPDTSSGNYYSLEQLRMEIKGKQEARKYYHNRMPLFTGFLWGASSILVAPLSPGLMFIPPAIGAVVASHGEPNMKKQKVSHPDLLNNREFMFGYSEIASKKKVKYSIIGGSIGLVLSVATLFIIK
jgi:hypothetical protein